MRSLGGIAAGLALLAALLIVAWAWLPTPAMPRPESAIEPGEDAVPTFTLAVTVAQPAPADPEPPRPAPSRRAIPPLRQERSPKPVAAWAAVTHPDTSSIPDLEAPADQVDQVVSLPALPLPAVAPAPTPAVLDRGAALLRDREARALPAISGALGALGFNGYLASMFESGGRLVVYASGADGVAGPRPVAELDQSLREAPAGDLGGHYTERPRILQGDLTPALRLTLDRLRAANPGTSVWVAVVLPRAAEAFILGALEEALGDLSRFSRLDGAYERGAAGGLVLTVDRGTRAAAGAAPELLSRRVILDIALAARRAKEG